MLTKKQRRGQRTIRNKSLELIDYHPLRIFCPKCRKERFKGRVQNNEFICKYCLIKELA